MPGTPHWLNQETSLLNEVYSSEGIYKIIKQAQYTRWQYMLCRRIKQGGGIDWWREYLKPGSLSSDTDPVPHSSLSSKAVSRSQRWGYVLKRDCGTGNCSESLYCCQMTFFCSIFWYSNCYSPALCLPLLQRSCEVFPVAHPSLPHCSGLPLLTCPYDICFVLVTPSLVSLQRSFSTLAI